MKKIVLGVAGIVLVLTLWSVTSLSQSGQAGTPPPVATPLPQVAGSPPQIAFDIPKSDVDTVLKNMSPKIDEAIRVVDMGKYNLLMAINHRGITNDKPGDPITGTYHTQVGEVYIMLSGTGILTTGGTEIAPTGSTGYNLTVGPSVNGTAGKGAFSRRLHAGDIVIIPPGVFHGWSQITEPVTYLSVRPDPDRALPAGYVNPHLLKNLPTPPQ